jgi:hypothetical protein
MILWDKIANPACSTLGRPIILLLCWESSPMRRGVRCGRVCTQGGLSKALKAYCSGVRWWLRGRVTSTTPASASPSRNPLEQSPPRYEPSRSEPGKAVEKSTPSRSNSCPSPANPSAGASPSGRSHSRTLSPHTPSFARPQPKGSLGLKDSTASRRCPSWSLNRSTSGRL